MFRFRISVGRGPRRRTFEWPRTSSMDSHSGTTGSQLSTLPLSTLPQSQCRLFNMPAEIRLYIYELALQVYGGTVNVEDLPKQHLSILQTCQRILHEAKAIFYSLHRFRYTPYTPHLFRIGPTRRNEITALTIVTSSGASAFYAIEKLHLFPKLLSLYIQREMSVRYLNVSEWSFLAKQMQNELGKLQTLQEVKVFTPTATSELTIAEKAREEKLGRVDALLQRGIQADLAEHRSQ